MRKIKVDEKYIEKEIYEEVSNNPAYKQADKKLQIALESLNLEIKNKIAIDDAVTCIETEVGEIAYKKGFHSGMQFILKALAGEEVIDL